MLSIEKTMEWIDGQIMVAELAQQVQPLTPDSTEQEVLLFVSINGRLTTLKQLRAEILGEKFETGALPVDYADINDEGPEIREW